MQILADENMPGLDCFSDLGRVRTMAGRQISRSDLEGIDVLLVRSVTRVDRQLLADTSVRFVGTATIGTDHLDTAWLTDQQIGWASAPGSNADSVVDYVLSSFAALDLIPSLLDGARVGIVGLGNVGGRLYRRLASLGITCIGYDPLLPKGTFAGATDLSTVLGCDVICLHTPLTRAGRYPSWHLFDDLRLRQIRAGAVLLNAGRGPVIAHEALPELAAQRRLRLVLDVWEQEPAVPPAVIDACEIATPHIAGYSIDGKWRATFMLRRALADWLQQPSVPATDRAPYQVTVMESGALANDLSRAIQAVYDVRDDDRRFRERCGSRVNPDGFDQLRRDYPPRRELGCTRIVNSAQLGDPLRRALHSCGFSVGVQ